MSPSPAELTEVEAAAIAAEAVRAKALVRLNYIFAEFIATENNFILQQQSLLAYLQGLENPKPYLVEIRHILESFLRALVAEGQDLVTTPIQPFAALSGDMAVEEKIRLFAPIMAEQLRAFGLLLPIMLKYPEFDTLYDYDFAILRDALGQNLDIQILGKEQSLDFASLLITSVQRGPRYNLLIADLKSTSAKAFGAASDKVQVLQGTLDQALDFVSDLNGLRRNYELFIDERTLLYAGILPQLIELVGATGKVAKVEFLLRMFSGYRFQVEAAEITTTARGQRFILLQDGVEVGQFVFEYDPVLAADGSVLGVRSPRIALLMNEGYEDAQTRFMNFFTANATYATSFRRTASDKTLCSFVADDVNTLSPTLAAELAEFNRRIADGEVVGVDEARQALASCQVVFGGVAGSEYCATSDVAVLNLDALRKIWRVKLLDVVERKFPDLSTLKHQQVANALLLFLENNFAAKSLHDHQQFHDFLSGSFAAEQVGSEFLNKFQIDFSREQILISLEHYELVPNGSERNVEATTLYSTVYALPVTASDDQLQFKVVAQHVMDQKDSVYAQTFGYKAELMWRMLENDFALQEIFGGIEPNQLYDSVVRALFQSRQVVSSSPRLDAVNVLRILDHCYWDAEIVELIFSSKINLQVDGFKDKRPIDFAFRDEHLRIIGDLAARHKIIAVGLEENIDFEERLFAFLDADVVARIRSLRGDQLPSVAVAAPEVAAEVVAEPTEVDLDALSLDELFSAAQSNLDVDPFVAADAVSRVMAATQGFWGRLRYFRLRPRAMELRSVIKDQMATALLRMDRDFFAAELPAELFLHADEFYRNPDRLLHKMRQRSDNMRDIISERILGANNLKSALEIAVFYSELANDMYLGGDYFAAQSILAGISAYPIKPNIVGNNFTKLPRVVQGSISELGALFFNPIAQYRALRRDMEARFNAQEIVVPILDPYLGSVKMLQEQRKAHDQAPPTAEDIAAIVGPCREITARLSAKRPRTTSRVDASFGEKILARLTNFVTVPGALSEAHIYRLRNGGKWQRFSLPRLSAEIIDLRIGLRDLDSIVPIVQRKVVDEVLRASFPALQERDLSSAADIYAGMPNVERLVEAWCSNFLHANADDRLEDRLAILVVAILQKMRSVSDDRFATEKLVFLLNAALRVYRLEHQDTNAHQQLFVQLFESCWSRVGSSDFSQLHKSWKDLGFAEIPEPRSSTYIYDAWQDLRTVLQATSIPGDRKIDFGGRQKQLVAKIGNLSNLVQNYKATSLHLCNEEILAWVASEFPQDKVAIVSEIQKFLVQDEEEKRARMLFNSFFNRMQQFPVDDLEGKGQAELGRQLLQVIFARDFSNNPLTADEYTLLEKLILSDPGQSGFTDPEVVAALQKRLTILRVAFVNNHVAAEHALHNVALREQMHASADYRAFIKSCAVTEMHVYKKRMLELLSSLLDSEEGWFLSKQRDFLQAVRKLLTHGEDPRYTLRLSDVAAFSVQLNTDPQVSNPVELRDGLLRSRVVAAVYGRAYSQLDDVMRRKRFGVYASRRQVLQGSGAVRKSLRKVLANKGFRNFVVFTHENWARHTDAFVNYAVFTNFSRKLIAKERRHAISFDEVRLLESCRGYLHALDDLFIRIHDESVAGRDIASYVAEVSRVSSAAAANILPFIARSMDGEREDRVANESVVAGEREFLRHEAEFRYAPNAFYNLAAFDSVLHFMRQLESMNEEQIRVRAYFEGIDRNLHGIFIRIAQAKAANNRHGVNRAMQEVAAALRNFGRGCEYYIRRGIIPDLAGMENSTRVKILGRLSETSPIVRSESVSSTSSVESLEVNERSQLLSKQRRYPALDIDDREDEESSSRMSSHF